MFVRAAVRFGVIAAAGELATDFGITGWQPGEAIQAAERCFRDWLEWRGTTGASDIKGAVSQVRAFIEAHGSSRFQSIYRSSLEGPDHDGEAREGVINRVGFRRCHPKTGETEYLILREAFRNEVCAGYEYRAVAKALDERGFLLREPPDMTIKPWLPDVGRTRVCGVRAAILESR